MKMDLQLTQAPSMTIASYSLTRGNRSKRTSLKRSGAKPHSLNLLPKFSQSHHHMLTNSVGRGKEFSDMDEDDRLASIGEMFSPLVTGTRAKLFQMGMVSS